MKKILCLILALSVFLSLASCKGAAIKKPQGENGGIDSDSKTYSMRLLYSAADSFNPYTAETDLNRNLCNLLFDSLIRLDNSFSAEYLLAESAVVSGNVCTVKLKNAYFTDGSPVTAEDVVYSYNLAKNSLNGYNYSLYEVLSVSAADGKTVIFNLSRNDRLFEKLLTFPILKSGSDKITDTDGRNLAPIGSGRYILNDENNKLTANGKHINGGAKVKNITLVNAPDKEAISHYVEIGATDLYYTDEADVSIVRMSGKRSTVNLGNMVYIGINHNYGQLSSPRIRHAISSAIDRTKICKDAYHNNAAMATGFYSPSIKELLSVQNLPVTADSQITIENLEEIGYNNLDSEGMRVNSSRNRLEFTLMVNRENTARKAAAKLIAEQLSAVGIKITVLERSFEEYNSALASGNFQLYIGEIKTLPNRDLSALTVPGGSCAFGIKAEEIISESTESDIGGMTIAEITNGYFAGANTITDVAVALQTGLPVIPICYRQGLLFHNGKIENIGEASENDIYFSIGQYTVKK